VSAGGNGVRSITAAIDNRGTLLLGTDLTMDAPNAVHVNSGTIDGSVTGSNLTLTQTASGSFTNTATGTITFGFQSNWFVTGGTLDLRLGNVTNPNANSAVRPSGATTFRFTPAAVNIPLVIGATVSLPDGVTVPAGDSLTFFGATTINASIANSGTILVNGAVAFNGVVTTAPGSAILLGALSGNQTLTLASGFTNNGTVELTSTAFAGNAQLVVTSGILSNSSTGTLRILPGVGGVRTLSAALDNSGIVTVSSSATFASALNQLNGGALTVAAGQTLTSNGLIQLFTGSTTTVLSGGSIVRNGGCSPLGGAFSGFSCP
jgi:hypothetical protein